MVTLSFSKQINNFGLQNFPGIACFRRGTIIAKKAKGSVTDMSISVSSLAKGISVGLTAGAIAYAVANATAKEKRSLKRNAGRALHAIGDIMEGVGNIMS